MEPDDPRQKQDALPKTKSLSLKIRQAPKGKDRLPSTIFQGELLVLGSVSMKLGISGEMFVGLLV